MKRMAFLPRRAFDQAKYIFQHIEDIDEANGSASNAMCSLFGNGGVPCLTLMSFYGAVLSRYGQMIVDKTVVAGGFTKEIRTL